MKVQATSLPNLAGDRVALRWLQPTDAPALYGIFGDPEVSRHWSSPAMQSVDEAHELVASIHRHFAAHDLYPWGVVGEASDQVIGTLTLAQLGWSNRRAEIGFSLARSHWGHGYMTEIAEVALDFAFGALGLRRVEADVDPRNEPSLRLLERLGFLREGYARERWEVAGEIQDSVLLALLAREWKASRSSPVDSDAGAADTQ